MKNQIRKTIRSFQTTLNAIANRIAFATLITLFLLNGLMSAQSATPQFVTFRDFIDQTTTADAGDYLARPGSQVKDAAAFEEMRQHILSLYQGVEVNHSFMVGSQHFDCVPIMQQPAVRKYGLKEIATPPPPPPGSSAASKHDLQRDPQHPFDAFGNYQYCEDQTVPMQRITMDTMTHFETLRHFLQKSPNEHLPGHNEKADPMTASHKYSYTQQIVNNGGGNSNLNVWNPYVNTSAGEIFSLSQEWYVGGIYSKAPPCGGTESCAIQTEEVGWIVYPDHFGDSNTHFFIYSTPDGYASGCYDDECGDFVIYQDGGLLGATISPISVWKGAQYEIQAQYILQNGNWWVWAGGNYIGYYPNAMYGGGQNSKYAQEIQFGTEGVGSGIWPQEGSGTWPKYGWTYAAYQRYLLYYDLSGDGHPDSLTPEIPSPNCYSINGPYTGTGKWSVYFYEGGPGGTGC